MVCLAPQLFLPVYLCVNVGPPAPIKAGSCSRTQPQTGQPAQRGLGVPYPLSELLALLVLFVLLSVGLLDTTPVLVQDLG